MRGISEDRLIDIFACYSLEAAERIILQECRELQEPWMTLDDSEILIRKIDCVDFIQTPANQIWLDINPEEVHRWEWTPYTPEVWRLLNHKTD